MKPLTTNLHRKGDHYGACRLPEFAISFKDHEGIRHPLLVRGRYLQCELHDAVGMNATALTFGDNPLACRTLKRSWWESFQPSNYRNIFGTPQLHLHDKQVVITLTCDDSRHAVDDSHNLLIAHNHVCATMLEEMRESFPYPLGVIEELLPSLPETIQDPTVLRTPEPIGINPMTWFQLEKADRLDMVPILRLEADRNINIWRNSLLTPSPIDAPGKEGIRRWILGNGDDIDPADIQYFQEELDSRHPPAEFMDTVFHQVSLLRAEAIQEKIVGRSLLPSFSREPKRRSLIKRASEQLHPPSNNTEPSAIEDMPIDFNGHRYRLSTDSIVECLAPHQNTPDHQQEVENLKRSLLDGNYESLFPVSIAIFTPVIEKAIRTRVTTKKESDITSLIAGCMRRPASWFHLDKLSQYVGQPVPFSEIPGYLARDLSPEQVIFWLQRGVFRANRVSIAENYHQVAPEVSPDLIAIATTTWPSVIDESALVQRLVGVENASERWRSLLEFQLAGWRGSELTHMSDIPIVHPGEQPPDPPPSKSFSNSAYIRSDVLERFLKTYLLPQEWWLTPALEAPGDKAMTIDL
jgi:hypothetical protein